MPKPSGMPEIGNNGISVAPNRQQLQSGQDSKSNERPYSLQNSVGAIGPISPNNFQSAQVPSSPVNRFPQGTGQFNKASGL